MENDKKLMSGAGDPPTSRWTVCMGAIPDVWLLSNSSYPGK